ncbi:MAG: alpha/beta fold hydrolase [Chloroflexi bacterium]|nr:alpha/beta fold hydrolase [Chloroflexota bacterium]
MPGVRGKRTFTMLTWMALGAVACVMLSTAIAAIFLADAITRSRRVRVQGTPADLGLRYEEIQFLTSDRLTLRGWFLDSPGARATVVLVHDLGCTRTGRNRDMLALQRDYIRRGFSVFAFDLRGHGESGGKRDTLGREERLDVQAAVAYARRRTGTTPIFLHGFGFGAALTLEAAAQGTDVTGVIADSPFVAMRQYMRHQYRRVPGPVFALASFFTRRLFRADMDAVQPIRAIERVTTPVLFIHNEGDPEVPPAHTLNLAAASLDPRVRVWIVSDLMGHGDAFRHAPEQYVRRCVQFVDELVPARPASYTATAQAAG